MLDVNAGHVAIPKSSLTLVRRSNTSVLVGSFILFLGNHKECNI